MFVASFSCKMSTAYRKMLRNRFFVAAILFVCLVLVIFFGSFIGLYVKSVCSGKQEILDTVKAVVSNESNPETVLNKIADWLTEHMTYDTRQTYFFPIPPLIFWRLPHPDPSWVMTIKRGGCGEYAILFSEMAKCAGIQSRVVHNPGEDHTWCEVLINGTWFHFDPLLPDGKRFNNTGIYERSRDEGGWGKQLSYVFFLGLDGEQHEITNRYTDTGRLTVRVEKDGIPVKNARVIIKSRFLMETNPSYHEPILCLEKYTNDSGLCTFNLGGNNYTVVAELGTLFGYRDEAIVHLDENTESSATLYLSQFSLLLPTQDIALILIIVLLSLVLLIELFLTYKKLKTNKRSSTSKNIVQHTK